MMILNVASVQAEGREVFQPEAVGNPQQNEDGGEDDKKSVGIAGFVWSLVLGLTPQENSLVKAAGKRESGDQSSNITSRVSGNS